MAGCDGHRGWLYAIAAYPEQQPRELAPCWVSMLKLLSESLDDAKSIFR